MFYWTWKKTKRSSSLNSPVSTRTLSSVAELYVPLMIIAQRNREFTDLKVHSEELDQHLSSPCRIVKISEVVCLWKYLKCVTILDVTTSRAPGISGWFSFSRTNRIYVHIHGETETETEMGRGLMQL